MTNANEGKPVTVTPEITAANNQAGEDPQKQATVPDEPVASASAGVQEEAADKGQAQGDDDLMSQPQKQPAGSDGEQRKWSQRISQARQTWGKLNDEELLKSEGEEQKLTALVRQRYAISREEAERQVKKFLGKADGR